MKADYLVEKRFFGLSKNFVVGLFMTLLLLLGLFTVLRTSISGEYAFIIGFFYSLLGFFAVVQVLSILDKSHVGLTISISEDKNDYNGACAFKKATNQGLLALTNRSLSLSRALTIKAGGTKNYRDIQFGKG